MHILATNGIDFKRVYSESKHKMCLWTTDGNDIFYQPVVCWSVCMSVDWSVDCSIGWMVGFVFFISKTSGDLRLFACFRCKGLVHLCEYIDAGVKFRKDFD